MFSSDFTGRGTFFQSACFLIAAIVAGVLSVCLNPPSVLAASMQIPDTGQTTCYNNDTEITCPGPGQAFYGQDANYKGKAAAYRDNGSTIQDLVTGLVWQQADDGVSRNGYDAATYCQDLDLGGQTDWRLPSVRELLSIVDAGRSSPAISPVFSCSTSTSLYWSTTLSAATASSAWTVGFSAGAAAANAKTLSYKVRCVRGNALPVSDYADNGNGTVTDQTTGLVWEKSGSASGLSWQDALALCENATTGGHTDWRLPNKRELELLVDWSRYDPALDPALTKLGNSYWSGTTYDPTGYAYEAWRVNFTDGQSRDYGKSVAYNVRCVRGGLTSLNLSAIDMLLQNGE
jgi:hypothetical protein